VSGQEDKFAKPRKKADPYETAILDFLDREIAGTRPTPDDRRQPDDVDALVSDLLKEAIAASDTREPSDADAAEELDALVSGILGSSDERTPPAPGHGGPAVDPEINRTLRLISQTQPPGTPLPSRKTVRPSDPDTAKGESLTALQQAVIDGAPRPFRSAGVASPHSETAPAEPTHGRSAPLFSLPDAGRSPLRRPLVVGSMVAGLLAAAGAGVYFLGPRSPVQQPPSTAGMTASISSASVPSASVPSADQPAPTLTPPPSSAALTADVGRTAQAGAHAASPSPESGRALAPAVKPGTNAPSNPTQAPLPAQGAGGDVVSEVPSATTPLPPPEPATIVESRPAVPEPQSPANTASGLGLTQGSAAQVGLAAAPRRSELGGYVKVAGPPSTSPALLPAVVMSKVPPVYPELARRNRFTGTVELLVQINAQGQVTGATVSSGPAVLRDAAKEAVMKWRYRPASRGGVALPSQARVAIVFNN
jgi:protein TonB